MTLENPPPSSQHGQRQEMRTVARDSGPCVGTDRVWDSAEGAAEELWSWENNYFSACVMVPWSTLRFETQF